MVFKARGKRGKRRYSRKKRRVNQATKKYVSSKISRQIESKAVTGYVNQDNNVAVGDRWLLTTLSQGVLSSNRVGNEVILKHYRMNLYVNFSGPLNATVSDVTDICRFVFIKCSRYIDPATASTWPSFDDVFAGFSSTAAADAPPILTTFHTKDFKVIKDFWMYADKQQGRWVQMRKIKFSKKKILGKLLYDENGWVKNALMLYTFSDSATTPWPQYWFRDRFIYKDA